MKIDATSPATSPVRAHAAAKARPAARTDDVQAAARPGRSHVQRDLKHLVRDIRHQVKDELQELRASGAPGSDEKIEAVRAAFHDFRDQVQAVFRDSGRGHGFDAGAVPDGLAQAMAAFTEALRALNGTDEQPTAPVVEDPAREGDPGPLPTPDLGLPTGALLDLTA